MEEARQHSVVDGRWFHLALTGTNLGLLVLAPLGVASALFGGEAFSVVLTVILALAFVNLVLWLVFGWQTREFCWGGVRICSENTSPTGFWVTMVFTAIAAAAALFGIYVLFL